MIKQWLLFGWICEKEKKRHYYCWYFPREWSFNQKIVILVKDKISYSWNIWKCLIGKHVALICFHHFVAFWLDQVWFSFKVLSVQFNHSLCLILCNPMNRSTPGLPVHHQLPEFTQTHIHWISDAIQPSHPLSSPSPPALNLSKCLGLSKYCLRNFGDFITFTNYWFILLCFTC